MDDPETPDPRRDLLRRITAIRRGIDPAVLDRARLAVFGKVPFDRDNARAAVSAFLDNRGDGGAFRRRLEAELDKEGATLDLDGASGAGPADPSPPPRRRPGRLA